MSNPNWPTIAFQVAFNADPNDPAAPAPTWTDLTTRLERQWDTVRGRQYELDQVRAGQMNARLQNKDGKLDPGNGATPATFFASTAQQLYRRARMQATWNGTTYSLFTGFAERWPQGYDHQGNYPYTTPVLVDAFAALASIQLRDVYAQEVLADNPLCYYPLTETQGSGFGDLVTGAVASVAHYGNGGTITLAGAALPFVDSMSAPQLNVTDPFTGNTDPNGAEILFPATTSMQPQAAGLSVECWYRRDTAQSGNETGEILRLMQQGGKYHRWGLSRTFTGVGTAQTLSLSEYPSPTSSTGHVNTLTGGNANIDDKQWHHLVIVWLANDGGVISYVDGAQDASFLYQPLGYATQFTGPLFIEVGNLYSGGNPPFADIAHVAVYPTPLSATRVAAHHQAALTGFHGESTGTRWSRILRYAGLPSVPASIDNGDSTSSAAAGLAGKTALAAMQDAVAAENGNHYVAGDGTITFRARSSRWKQTTPKWVFGENTGEIPYSDPISYDTDPTLLYNQVVLDRPGGVTVKVSNAASVRANFTNTLTATINVDTDNEVIDRANGLLNERANPVQRLSTIVVNAAADPTVFASVLAMELGDLVTVNRRPLSGAPAKSMLGFIEQIRHVAYESPGTWRVELQISPASPYRYWLLGDSTYGVLGSTTVAAY